MGRNKVNSSLKFLLCKGAGWGEKKIEKRKSFLFRSLRIESFLKKKQVLNENLRVEMGGFAWEN